jgi:lipid II:glycine glycyltransferase (peptidoglycan interpeptide bridge formation enzyme)
MKEMNSGCKERVKKAIKNQIEFWVATPDQYEMFYTEWLRLAWWKWFNIIPKNQYYDLIKYFDENNRWKLFIAQKDWELVAGSICAFDDHQLTYLYGFSNRKFGNIWWHHFLKFKIFWRARENDFTYVDMMWWAPTWFPEHSLTSVSAFKESLWWIKIEQYGSYDIVLNKFLYKVFERYTKLRGK